MNRWIVGFIWAMLTVMGPAAWAEDLPNRAGLELSGGATNGPSRYSDCPYGIVKLRGDLFLGLSEHAGLLVDWPIFGKINAKSGCESDSSSSSHLGSPLIVPTWVLPANEYLTFQIGVGATLPFHPLGYGMGVTHFDEYSPDVGIDALPGVTGYDDPWAWEYRYTTFVVPFAVEYRQNEGGEAAGGIRLRLDSSLDLPINGEVQLEARFALIAAYNWKRVRAGLKGRMYVELIEQLSHRYFHWGDFPTVWSVQPFLGVVLGPGVVQLAGTATFVEPPDPRMTIWGFQLGYTLNF